MDANGYLGRERVVSGEALEAARKEYRSRNRRSQARDGIPEAWRELVEKMDTLLVEMPDQGCTDLRSQTKSLNRPSERAT